MGRGGLGMIGLETALSVVQATMVDTGLLDWAGVADRMSRGPARIGRLRRPRAQPLAVGAPANLTLVDPAARWTVRPEALASPSRNTPYAGRRAARPGRGDVPARSADGARRHCRSSARRRGRDGEDAA